MQFARRNRLFDVFRKIVNTALKIKESGPQLSFATDMKPANIIMRVCSRRGTAGLLLWSWFEGLLKWANTCRDVAGGGKLQAPGNKVFIVSRYPSGVLTPEG